MEQNDQQGPGQIIDQLKEQINDLYEEIVLQPNIFLQKQLKEFMIQFARNIAHQIKPYFPAWFEERVKNIRSNMTEYNTTEVLGLTLAKFQNMEVLETSYNQAANILLDTTLSKRLPLNLSTKLIRLIQTAKQDYRILEFLQERFQEGGNQKQFLSEITAKKIRNRVFKTLNTLIANIIELRPRDKPILQRLQQNKENCKVFENQLIQIIDQSNGDRVNGKITKASYRQSTYKFEVVRFKQQSLIHLQLDNGSIEKIVFEDSTVQPLKNIVKIPFLDMRTQKNVVSICHNKNGYSGSTVLPQAVYDMQLDKKNMVINFISQDREKRYYFKIILNKDNKPEKLKYLDGGQFYLFDEFLNSHLVKQKKQKQFVFSSNQNISQYVKIYKSYSQDEGQFIEKLQILQKKKQQLFGKIFTIEKNGLNKLFEKLIRSKPIYPDLLKCIKVKNEVENILQLSRQLGYEISVQTLMEELLHKVNYASLVDKDQTLNTIKAVELFTSSESYTKTINDKHIIAFYGDTGSGKSTSVNFLIGIPLQKVTNRFGDNVIRVISGEQGTEMNKQLYSKIGQSNGLSQTLFTKGYDILDVKQTEKELYDNVVLSDNPGFGDTRGTQYELCTNLSMDRAIEVCRSIRSIILVVPYQAIVSKKGTPLLQSMFEMANKFPQILNESSNVRKNFYLLITKNTSRQQNMQTISLKFQEIQDQLRQHHTLKIKSYDQLQKKLQEQRLKIYALLTYMCNQERIDVIDINNQLTRQDLLKKYASSKVPVSSAQYKKTMTDHNKMLKFLNQISASAHNFTKLILEPYTKSLVQQIDKLQINRIDKYVQLQQTKRNIDKLQHEVQENQGQIMKKQLAACELKEKIEQMQRVQKDKIYQFIEQKYNQWQKSQNQLPKQPTNGNSQFFAQAYIDVCERKINIYLRQIQTLKAKATQYYQKIINNQKILQNLSSQSQELKNKIKNWQQGEFQEEIFKLQQKLGQTIYVGSHRLNKQQRLKLISKGQLPSQSPTSSKFKCGELEKKLFQIVKISKDYILMPNSNFDPNQYISKNVSVFGKYKAIIQCNKCELQGVRLFEEGKVIFISVLEHYIVTKNQNELPFLRIVHKIPNQEYNSDLIRNAVSEVRQIAKKTAQIQENIQSAEEETKIILKDITSCQKLIAEYRQRQKQAELDLINQKKAKVEQQKFQRKLTQCKKKFLDNCIAIEEHKNKKVQISKFIEKILKCQNEKQNIDTKIKQLQFIQKRFALLLKDQFQKKIPQTTANYICIAKKMIKQIASEKKMLQIDFQNKIKNLEFFMQQYQKIKDTIEEQVEQHLSRN